MKQYNYFKAGCIALIIIMLIALFAGGCNMIRGAAQDVQWLTERYTSDVNH